MFCVPGSPDVSALLCYMPAARNVTRPFCGVLVNCWLRHTFVRLVHLLSVLCMQWGGERWWDLTWRLVLVGSLAASTVVPVCQLLQC